MKRKSRKQPCRASRIWCKAVQEAFSKLVAEPRP